MHSTHGVPTAHTNKDKICDLDGVLRILPSLCGMRLLPRSQVLGSLSPTVSRCANMLESMGGRVSPRCPHLPELRLLLVHSTRASSAFCQAAGSKETTEMRIKESVLPEKLHRLMNKIVLI
jgi:hypothetical protein